jgi:hypothetical protein
MRRTLGPEAKTVEGAGGALEIDEVIHGPVSPRTASAPADLAEGQRAPFLTRISKPVRGLVGGGRTAFPPFSRKVECDPAGIPASRGSPRWATNLPGASADHARLPSTRARATIIERLAGATRRQGIGISVAGCACLNRHAEGLPILGRNRRRCGSSLRGGLSPPPLSMRPAAEPPVVVLQAPGAFARDRPAVPAGAPGGNPPHRSVARRYPDQKVSGD